MYGYFSGTIQGLLVFSKFISLLRIVSIRDVSSSASLTGDVVDEIHQHSKLGDYLHIFVYFGQWQCVQRAQGLVNKYILYFRVWKMLIIINSINNSTEMLKLNNCMSMNTNATKQK